MQSSSEETDTSLQIYDPSFEWRGSFRAAHKKTFAHVCRVAIQSDSLSWSWEVGPGIARNRRFHVLELIGCRCSETLDIYAVRTKPKPSDLKIYVFSELGTGKLDEFHRRIQVLLQSTTLKVQHAMSTRRMLFIVNPYSGHRTGVEVMERVRPMFGAAGILQVVHVTTHAGHARELVRSARTLEYDAIVTVGGDGTVNEVLTGMFERAAAGGDGSPDPAAIPLGVIPAGNRRRRTPRPARARAGKRPRPGASGPPAPPRGPRRRAGRGERRAARAWIG